MCLLIVQLLVRQVRGSGILSIHFKTFNNPGGKGNNGHCCDGKLFMCESRGCDHYFEICADVINGYTMVELKNE